MDQPLSRAVAEGRFKGVFAHFDDVRAYAARRGCVDPEGVAAETMAIAWRRLVDIPLADPRPWLFATARNLAFAEWRSRRRLAPPPVEDLSLAAPVDPRLGLADELEPRLVAALGQLSDDDRETLLLVAWEELSPKLAAESLGISPTSFRVRLHRARSRFRSALEEIEKESGRPARGRRGLRLEGEK